MKSEYQSLMTIKWLFGGILNVKVGQVRLLLGPLEYL